MSVEMADNCRDLMKYFICFSLTIDTLRAILPFSERLTWSSLCALCVWGVGGAGDWGVDNRVCHEC